MGMSTWWDFVVLAVSLVIGISCLGAVTRTIAEAELPRYEDKSYFNANDAIQVYQYPRDGRDIMALLMVADEYTPYPGRIRVNDTPIITLDKNWVAYRNKNINVYYSSSGVYKFQDLLDKKILSVEFVHGTDPATGAVVDYIQYRTE